MAEGIILPLAKSIVGKIASFAGNLVLSSVTAEIKAAKSAKADLNIISEKLEAICAVLADAEERQYANNAIKIWLRDLKSVVYDIDDLLDEVATDALQRKINEGHLGRQLRYYLSSSNPLISLFVLSRKVRILREKLDNIVAKKNEFNLTERTVEISNDEMRSPLDRSPYVHEPTIIGREAAKRDILSKVSTVSNASSELSVLPIVGMGGIGKTALAKLVYKDVDALDFDMKLWACVSDKFQLEKIVQDIVKDGTGLCIHDVNILIKRLHELLEDKKYFLVLDDVWEEDIAQWLELKNLLTVGKPGSIILVTTRGNHVASVVGTVESYKLDTLPFEECWNIFKQLSFQEGEEERHKNLVEIGLEIVKKCDGIPLVVRCLGSLLRTERAEQQWETIKNMDSFVGLQGQYYEKKVMSILRLSYNNLPSHLKPCFAYLSLFEKDRILTAIDVISKWRALGLLQGEIEVESIGHSYFLEIESRSLLHELGLVPNSVFFTSSKMHDLVHDLATKIMEEELFIVTQDNMEVSSFTRHLTWGCKGSNDLKEITFPRELLNAANIRSFKFGYKMRDISRSFLEAIISNFSHLRILDLSESQFEELPNTIGNLKHLRLLDLSHNGSLISIPNSMCKLFNLETLFLSGCSLLKKLPDDIYILQSLRYIYVTTCQLRLGKKFHELSSVRMLGFGECKRLKSLWDDCNIGHLTSLRCLIIDKCPKLTCLPKSMKFLSSLESLYIDGCEMLDLEKEESLQGLQRLRLLLIKGVPKLKRLPNGLQSAAASLQTLAIVDCEGLVELPDWLQCFTSLQHVGITNCPNILALPREFGHLTSLQQLEIFGCLHLSERCAVPTGEDYFLVQHIPEFILDGVTYTSLTSSS